MDINIINSKLNDKNLWQLPSISNSNKSSEIAEKLAYLFNNATFVSPSLLSKLDDPFNGLSLEDKMNIRAKLKPGDLRLNLGGYFYWSLGVADHQNLFLGKVTNTSGTNTVQLNTFNPEHLKLVKLNKTPIIFEILVDGEWLSTNKTYVCSVVDPDAGVLKILTMDERFESLEGIFVGAKVWEAGGFVEFISEIEERSGNAIDENNPNAVWDEIQRLTTQMTANSNVDTPEYRIPYRWRNYYLSRLAYLYIRDDNMTDLNTRVINNTMFNNDPNLVEVYEVLNNSMLNKETKMTRLLEIGVTLKNIAKSPAQSLSEIIASLINDLFYSVTYEIVIHFYDSRYDSPTAPGGDGAWNRDNSLYSGFSSLSGTSFDSIAKADDTNGVNTDYFGDVYNAAKQGGISFNLNLGRMAGIKADQLDKFSHSASSTIFTIQEANFYDYTAGNFQYAIEVKSVTNQPGVFNLSCRVFAAQNYHAGHIGASILAMSKRISV